MDFPLRGVGTCPHCGKVRYRSRGEARAARRVKHPGEKMHAYPCGDYWHFGHDEMWREMTPDDLVWTPLPPAARVQMLALARACVR